MRASILALAGALTVALLVLWPRRAHPGIGAVRPGAMSVAAAQTFRTSPTGSDTGETMDGETRSAVHAPPGAGTAAGLLPPPYPDQRPSRPAETHEDAVLEAIVRDSHGQDCHLTCVTVHAKELPDQSWYSHLDRPGFLRVEYLPARVPLELEVSAHEMARLRHESIVLEPGETRRIELTLSPGCTITGTLVDRTGAPIQHCTIWLASEERCEGSFFRSFEQPEDKAATNGAGTFRFDRVSAGAWWIGPAYPGKGHDVSGIDAVPPVCTAVTVAPEQSNLDVLLIVDRGLFIEGLVIDSGGSVAPGVSVVAQRREAGGITETATDDAGRFRLGPLCDGEWTVSAAIEMPGTEYESEPRHVRAGATGVVLQSRLGGRVQGVVRDARTKHRVQGKIAFSRKDADSWGQLRDTGFRYSLVLEPGLYVARAWTEDGLWAMRDDIRVDAGSRTTIDLNVEPGTFVALRFEGDAEQGYYEAHLEGVRIDRGYALRGVEVVRVLPARRVDLRLASAAGQVEERTLEGVPGEHNEIVWGRGD